MCSFGDARRANSSRRWTLELHSHSRLSPASLLPHQRASFRANLELGCRVCVCVCMKTVSIPYASTLRKKIYIKVKSISQSSKKKKKK